MNEHLLQHHKLGPILGKKTTNAVTQYLGIKYASLSDRFARAELLLDPQGDRGTPRGVLNATKKGPSILLPPGACKDHQTSIVQKTLPIQEEVEESDLDGLTLNISVPSGGSYDSLPVFVFVCGGGFTSGSADYPEYDLGRITELSVEAKMPMISVGINYRVGVPGFSYSTALKDCGYKPNNGLDDQRLALRWIKNNIAGFGGEPGRVTFVGESAGAACAWFQLQSPENLFQQVIALSGSSFLRPRPLALLEKGFEMAATELGGRDLSPEEKVKKLVEAPKEEFKAKLGRKCPAGPFMDGELIGTLPTYTDLTRPGYELATSFPALAHCKRLMMGDCQMDGMGFHSRVRGRTDILPKTLADALTSVFDPVDGSIAPRIISAYNLQVGAESNSIETTKSCLDFAADVSFALPARYLTKSWASSGTAGSAAYLCHFNCPNPWDGPWKGHATHALDIIMALQNYRDHLSPGQQKCAERLAKDMITFVNGAEPWPSYTGERPGAMVYDAPMSGSTDESQFVETFDPQRTGRSNVLVDLVGEGMLDKLVEASQKFLVGPLTR